MVITHLSMSTPADELTDIVIQRSWHECICTYDHLSCFCQVEHAISYWHMIAEELVSNVI